MLQVLSKLSPIFEYIRDEKGRPTGETRDQLAISPTNFIVTAKIDGTCCYIKDGQIFARQDVKKNIANAPSDWFPTAGLEPDRGGHIIGFRPLDRKRGDKWHIMAIDEQDSSSLQILFELNGNSGRYILKTENQINPFIPGILHDFVLHDSIA